MTPKKVIVIGAGIGGLEVAAMLAMRGVEVLVLERERQIGGALQSFSRAGMRFDTGFHYVGGLNPGGALRSIFERLDLMDLPWLQMDVDAADVVTVGGDSFDIPQGHERFAERMSSYFPKERDNIFRYTDFLKSVGDNIFESLKPHEAADVYTSSLFAKSAYEFLNCAVSDPLLRKVLSGSSLKMQLDADTTPLYLFAQINNSFIESSWRLQGGGEVFCSRLRDVIVRNGGEVRTLSEVTRIVESDGSVSGVEVNGSEFIPASLVVSDLHPALTLTLMPESKAIRRMYRARMSSLRNSFGMFTMNCRLKPGTVRYRNSNLYFYDESADLWRFEPSSAPKAALVSFYPSDGEYADRIDILTPMAFSEVSEWADSRIGSRPEAYRDFMKGRTEALLSFVARWMPDLPAAVERAYTSSPLSYLSYTCSPEGSAFGVMKDWRSPMTTLIPPQTPLPNLFLTGQNLNLHGVLGTSMTALQTMNSIDKLL